MTICPVAIAVGCKKCPVFSVCPVKSVIGDYRPPDVINITPRSADKDTPPKADKV